MDKYQVESEKLSKAIDIAIEALKKYTPSRFRGKDLSEIIEYSLMYKDMALNPEKKYRNLSSLKYLINSNLTLFQEDRGDHVEYFWRKLKESNIDYERKDVLKKVLNKKRISNIHDMDVVIDTLVVAEQDGRITHDEALLLGKYVYEFQAKGKRKE